MNNWIEKEQPKKETIQSLKKDIKIDDFLCSLLLQRKVNTLAKAQEFFRPDINLLHDPFLMKDMKKVVEKIENSREERIMILGDYDVDGTTSTAMLYTYFKNINYDILYYIPDRYSEGYGVSEKAIEYAEKNRVSLIITVDCGIKAINQVDISNSKNIEMIICDHHLPGDQIPNAFGILNPKQKNCKYPFKDLCGCGIAYKLITAHNSLLKNSIDISIFLDFVALATISDMMPLIDENRIMVFHGLNVINSKPRIGLRNFLKSINGRIDESKISFNIGPRINAAGRMKTGKIIVDLLVEEDINRANTLSNDVEYLNENRRRIEKDVVDEALKQIDNERYTNIVYGERWNQGVLGIVASRIIERSYKPTVVLTESNEDILTGSVRSVKDYDVYKSLSDCQDNLIQYGGHKYAAGLKLKKSKFKIFKNQFESIVKDSVGHSMFTRSFSYDLLIDFSKLTIDNIKIIRRMSPFGLGNRRPVFRTNNCFIDSKLQFLGKDEQIVKSKIKDKNGSQLPFICFDKKSELVDLQSSFDVLYNVNLNSFSGQEVIELTLREIFIKK
jgi:single-stranded-DNA-specific exonuclease